MAGGRPTDYLPEYCERVVQAGKQGKSLAWMAADLDVTKQTLHNWAASNPQFLDAMDRAKLHSQRWWEDKGQDNIINLPAQGTLNAGVYSRSMAARFPDDWREKSETALTGAGGGAIHIVATEHDENL